MKPGDPIDGIKEEVEKVEAVPGIMATTENHAINNNNIVENEGEAEVQKVMGTEEEVIVLTDRGPEKETMTVTGEGEITTETEIETETGNLAEEEGPQITTTGQNTESPTLVSPTKEILSADSQVRNNTQRG